MNYVITGCSGFVGKNYVNFIKKIKLINIILSIGK